MQEISSSVFLERIQMQLQEALPGIPAQLLMAPAHRLPHEQWEQYYERARVGAVLILFYLHNENIKTVFIKRPTYNGVHSGQIAFPGGGKEENDKDLISTALREAYEEIGVVEREVKVMGTLTELYIPPSNFLITPVIGWAEKMPQFKINKNEVAEILEISIDELAEKNPITEKEIEIREGIVIRVPYYDLNGHFLWGATAMIVCELKEILKKVLT
jgi:8-oxo-dGTP pyrophosphatase MutT (NUDIX family)